MEDAIQLIVKAAHFAASAHGEQRRKDAKATPYFNHLAEVAWLLSEAGCDAHVIAAGYLHDTIEDVGVTYETLVAEFGPDVADLVQAVTDDKSLEKSVRKSQQVEHAAHATPRQAELKLADKISNLRSLMSTPPAGWSAERLTDYASWAHQVVTALPARNAALFKEYESARAALLVALNTE